MDTCPDCAGTGEEPCPDCRGAGDLTDAFGWAEGCNTCAGTGNSPYNYCETCDGRGEV